MTAFKLKVEVNLIRHKVMELVSATGAAVRNIARLVPGQRGRQTSLVNKIQGMLEESQAHKGFFCSGNASSL